MSERWEGVLTEAEFVELLEQRRDGRPLRTFAAELGGVNFQSVGAVLKGQKSPGIRIPELLGYEPITVYRPLQQSNKKVSKR